MNDNRRQRFPALNPKLLRELYESGLTISTIATAYHITESYVCKKLKLCGIAPNYYKPIFTRDEFRCLYFDRKLSRYRIAKMYNVSETVVEIYSLSFGLCKPQRKRASALDEKIFYDLYKKGTKIGDIAKMFDFPATTVWKAVHKVMELTKEQLQSV